MQALTTLAQPAQICTIGGSDSSAGAGIQADLLTCSAIGQQLNYSIDCTQIVTAVTAQHHQQVLSINPVSIDVLESQWQSLLTKNHLPGLSSEQANTHSSGVSPIVIKVGLLANNEQIVWLSEKITWLKQQRRCLLVLDPVVNASAGNTLTEQQTKQALIQHLLPVTDVLTANWQEALNLTDFISTQTALPEQESHLVHQLHKLGAKQVIIKGGHRPDSTNPESTQKDNTSNPVCFDALYSKVTNKVPSKASNNTLSKHTVRLMQPRITLAENNNVQEKGVRGTGCAFASALATVLAIGYPINDAFVLANTYVHRGIKHRTTMNCGAFTLLHSQQLISLNQFPTPELPSAMNALLPQAPFPTCHQDGDDDTGLGLYPVVDSVDWIARLLPLGIKTIQLRIKSGSTTQIRDAIFQANTLCKQYHCRLFINDYWQLAIEAGCYGVHLGQEDILQADLAQIQQAGLRLGTSTHGFHELLIALQLQPSYVAIGAIFPTKTKDMTGQIQGIAKLKQLQQLLCNAHPNLPVVAIGGINQGNIESVLQTGVQSVAVVTAITQANQPAKAVAALQQFMNKASTR